MLLDWNGSWKCTVCKAVCQSCDYLLLDAACMWQLCSLHIYSFFLSLCYVYFHRLKSAYQTGGDWETEREMKVVWPVFMLMGHKPQTWLSPAYLHSTCVLKQKQDGSQVLHASLSNRHSTASAECPWLWLIDQCQLQVSQDILALAMKMIWYACDVVEHLIWQKAALKLVTKS